ncbi:MAG: DUF2975 domain-containing protein, partial [Cytophagales bacterium]|nr:DUF2975 domain-containing protein [Rhizobacter sp.]
MPPESPVLQLFQRVLRLLVWLNLLFAVAVVAAFGALLVAPERFMALLGSRDPSVALIAGMRLLAVIGVASVPLAHIVLTRLLAIVATVRDGDPFVAENAARLRRMAWALLGLEAMHLVAIAVAVRVSDASNKLDWSFSFTGWLAVLLLFVLAEVFAHGSRL